MRVSSVTVQGFRSFASPQTLEPTKGGPGLYYVTGRNEVEPELEANGAGKSSLFEALFWCFYGRTSRGLRAGSVQCWLPKSPKCRVAVVFDHHGQHHELIRAWSPNVLTLDGRPVDQEQLEQVVGLGPDAFLQAVYFAQFTPAFVDLPPSERLALLSNVLRLEKWEKASAHCTEQVRVLEKQRSELQHKTAAAEGEICGLDTDSLGARESEWATRKQERLAELERNQTALQSEADTVKRRLTIFQRTEEKLPVRSNAEPAASPLPALRSDLTVAESALNKAVAQEADLKSQVRLLNKEKKEITDLDTGDPCPICRQPIAAKHIKAETKRIDDQLKELENQVEVAALHREQVQDTVTGTRNRIREDEAHESEARQAKATKDAAKAKIESDLRLAEDRVARLTAERKRVSGETNPHTAALARAHARKQELTDRIQDLQTQLHDVEQLVTAIGYWTKGFKDLRLFVVQRVLSQLELEVNNTLVALGLADWTIKFSIEQETKSGTLKRGFTILIHAPHSEDAVPFEVWSGGEAQRLRIATGMGLANLIGGRLGLDSNIELWDEPSSWLSDAGITEMLGVLEERAKSTGRSLWLADHRTLDYGGFVGVITAVKTAQGTRIEGALPVKEQVKAANNRLPLRTRTHVRGMG